MGFLNFLTRRSNHDGLSDRAFKLQNGNPLATASLQSVGTHKPVQKLSLEQLQNSSARSKSRQTVTRTTKPYFLGVRGDRPSTANSEGRPSLLRSVSSCSKAYGTTNSDAGSLAPSIPSITVSRSYSSMRTSGYVDLLDAQSGFKPYDFRTRIQAAGVRDYGEDVAERNIGENGVDVGSVAAQEFYQKQKRLSTTTLSNISHILETDAFPSSVSEASDLHRRNSSICSSTRSPSRLSMQPRNEVSGVIAGSSSARGHSHKDTKASKSSAHGTAERRGVRQDLFITTQSGQLQRQRSQSSSGERSRSSRKWISTEQPVASHTRGGRWEARVLSPDSRSRSISPPCVPRYRPASSLTTMQEEDDHCCGPSPESKHTRPSRGGKLAAKDQSAQDDVPILLRDDFQNDNIDGRTGSDSEYSAFDNSPSNHGHAVKQNTVPAAPPQYHPDWQSAVQRAVEESLAKLPLSADVRALLELSQSGIPLDDILQNAPLRRFSLHQGSTISMSPTTDLSDYASSHTGRPHSRHTATTSIDSSARVDLYHKSPSSANGDKSAALDQHQGSPYLMPIHDGDATTAHGSHTQSEVAQFAGENTQKHGIIDIEDLECLTSDFSDVDSFTEKRRQVLDEDEAKLFHREGFGDISNNLPGIVDFHETRSCTICNILSNLQDGSGQMQPCTHNGALTQKQRLRALGYDYESEESDTEKPILSVRGRSTTKKLTAGSNGGLRRLKLVDDRIDEDSEEERDDSREAPRHHPGLRRKAKFPKRNAALGS